MTFGVAVFCPRDDKRSRNKEREIKAFSSVHKRLTAYAEDLTPDANAQLAALLGSDLVLAPTIALYRRLIVRDRETAEPVPTPAD